MNAITVRKLAETGYTAERCGHHIHLTAEDTRLLFQTTELPIEKELSVLNEYATPCFVEIKTKKKGEAMKIRVLASTTPRKYSQIEVDAGTYFKLFGETCPKLRNSGDVQGAQEILVKGPFGEIMVPVIVPIPHIHIPPEFPTDPFHLEFPSGIIVPITVKYHKTRGDKGFIHLDAGLYDGAMPPNE